MPGVADRKEITASDLGREYQAQYPNLKWMKPGEPPRELQVAGKGQGARMPVKPAKGTGHTKAAATVRPILRGQSKPIPQKDPATGRFQSLIAMMTGQGPSHWTFVVDADGEKGGPDFVAAPEFAFFREHG